MIKAVYDTNVVVSGLLNPEGIPSFILDLATQGYIRLFLSEEIVKEYEEVLVRPRFGFSRKRVKSHLHSEVGFRSNQTGPGDLSMLQEYHAGEGLEAHCIEAGDGARNRRGAVR